MTPVLRHFHPVLASDALDSTPARVEVDGEAFVLFRDRTGGARCLVDRCPHRFAPLSAGRVRPDGRLSCAYHGWHFDGHGHGHSPSQPTLTGCDVQALQVIERYGRIWIAAADVKPDHFPNFEVDDWIWAGGFDAVFAAPLHVALDNFSEDEHTPWVHGRLGWSERDVGTVDYSADNHDDRVEVHYSARQRPTWARHLIGLGPQDRFHNDWITWFDPVRTRYDIAWSDPVSGQRRPAELRSYIFMVPETAKSTRFHVLVWMRLGGWLRPLAPALRPLTVALVRREIEDDRRFITTVAGTPYALTGMRLGRFDKPIIHARKLLEEVYRRAPDTGVTTLRRRARETKP